MKAFKEKLYTQKFVRKNNKKLDFLLKVCYNKEYLLNKRRKR